jgi:hypothetical protein
LVLLVLLLWHYQRYELVKLEVDAIERVDEPALSQAWLFEHLE